MASERQLRNVLSMPAAARIALELEGEDVEEEEEEEEENEREDVQRDDENHRNVAGNNDGRRGRAVVDGTGGRTRSLNERPLHVFVNVDASRAGRDEDVTKVSASARSSARTPRRRSSSQPVHVVASRGEYAARAGEETDRELLEELDALRRRRKRQRSDPYWCCISLMPFRGIRNDIRAYVGDDEDDDGDEEDSKYAVDDESDKKADGAQRKLSLHQSLSSSFAKLSFYRRLLWRWGQDWSVRARFPFDEDEDEKDEQHDHDDDANNRKKKKKDMIDSGNHYPGLIIRTAIYVFMSSLLSALTMGQFFTGETEGNLGILETIVSAGLAGCLQSLFGGQPLIIMGNTGSIVILYILVFKTAADYKIPFFGWLGFTNIWAAGILIVLATFNVSDVVSRFTRFTGEILEVIISFDLVASAIQGIVREFMDEGERNEDYSWFVVSGLLAIIFSMSMFIISKWMQSARKWTTLWYGARTFIVRFGPIFTVIAITIISYLPQWAGRVPASIPRRLEHVSRWGVPGSLKAHWANWLNMADCSPGQAMAAVIPGACIAAMLFVDHNMTTRLSTEGYGTRVQSTLHYDLLLLAVNLFICGLIGIPPSSATVPSNPEHTRALVKRKIVESSVTEDASGTLRTKRAVVEQRFTNFIQSFALLTCMFVMPLFGYVPTSLMWGNLLVLGTYNLNEGSEFFLRAKLLVSSSSSRRMHKAAFLSISTMQTISAFTIIQIVLCLLIIGLTILQMVTSINIATILYPVLVILCAFPIRSNVLPCIFTSADIEALDNDFTYERIPPKANKRTKLNAYTAPHKGGNPLKRKVSQAEVEMMVRRRDTETSQLNAGAQYLFYPPAPAP